MKKILMIFCIFLLSSCIQPINNMLPGEPFSSPSKVKLHTPSFLPDGKNILFCMQDETQTTIYKLNIERNTKPISLKNYRQFDYNPICSPNGDKIAFESSDGGPQADICLMDIDGSNKVSITLSR